MNKGIIGIVAIIVIVMLVLGVVLIGGTSYWETDVEFGVWQDELVLVYADGSEKSLKLINEEINNPLAFYSGGEKVTSCYLTLKAKVTGTGYTGAEIDCQQFGYTRKAYKYNLQKKLQGPEVYTSPNIYRNTDYQVPIGTTETIFSKSDTELSFSSMLSSEPDNGYIIKWAVQGTAKYKGYPGGATWKTATNPPNRSLVVVKDTAPTGEIFVTLYSDASAS